MVSNEFLFKFNYVEKECCSNPWHRTLILYYVWLMITEGKHVVWVTTSYVLDVLDRMLLAVASGQAGQVLVRQLFWRPNLNYVELKIITASSIIPEKATQGTAASRFALFTATSVHSVAVCLLVTMKPTIWHVAYCLSCIAWLAYHWPTQVIWLWNMCAAKFECAICSITGFLSIWLLTANQNLACHETSPSKITYRYRISSKNSAQNKFSRWRLNYKMATGKPRCQSVVWVSMSCQVDTQAHSIALTFTRSQVDPSELQLNMPSSLLVRKQRSPASDEGS